MEAEDSCQEKFSALTHHFLFYSSKKLLHVLKECRQAQLAYFGDVSVVFIMYLDWTLIPVGKSSTLADKRSRVMKHFFPLLLNLKSSVRVFQQQCQQKKWRKVLVVLITDHPERLDLIKWTQRDTMRTPNIKLRLTFVGCMNLGLDFRHNSVTALV